MIKVLNIISDTNVGGAGRVIINYLKYFDRRTFDVSVLLPKGSLLIDMIREFDVPIYEIDAMADESFDFSAIKKLKTMIKEIDPDIVHTHGSMAGRIAAKGCGKITIFTRHSAFSINARYTKGIGKTVYKFINEHYSDRIIAVSPVCRDDLVLGGISENRIDVILNGVEPLTALSTDEIAAAKASYGLQQDEFIAVIMARIEHYKGHRYILEAAKMLKQQGRHIKVLIAGTGDYEDEVKSLAEELDVTDCVMFLGFVDDIRSLLCISDIQLNASYIEATSLSLLEGMSLGVPAVVSDYGGNPWVIEDGINGLIFKTHDSFGLAECIAHLMDNPDVLQQMREKAREIYLEKFTGQVFAHNVEKTYLKALEENKSGKK